MPPLRPKEGQDDAAPNDPDEAGNRNDPEDVYPRAHEDGLSIRQQMRQRQTAF
jgi:hypothetical protein